MIPFEWIEQAYAQLKQKVVCTPITYSHEMGFFLKWENYQTTGSFKLRGAWNKVLSLKDWELSKGLVTCSAGNHGQGLALACRSVNAKCTVFASDHASPLKLDAMRSLGASVELVDGDYALAESMAKAYADKNGKVFVSPYNDGQVIAGQASIALEFLEQMGDHMPLDVVLVPVGGGGLISGIGAVLAELENPPKLIGVQSEASPYAWHLLQEGNQNGVIETDSLADGLAGALESGSITIPLMKRYVNDIILVSEDEIRFTIKYAWSTWKERIEGSAAVGLAAVLSGKINSNKGLIVISGGNIQEELFSEILLV